MAYQPNFGYAPVMIMKAAGFLKDELPDYDVSFQQSNSGALIRSGMVSGDIHFGAMAISPFLVGLDRGLDWGVVSGLSDIDQWFMVGSEQVSSLSDFAPDDKIGVLSSDNNQAALLRVAAQRHLGAPDALDSRLVFQPHADAMQALLSGRIAGHFTNPPYQFIEEEAGMYRLLGSREIYAGVDNPPTFGLLTALRSYADQNPEVIGAVQRSVEAAVALIENEKEEATRILAGEFGSDHRDAFSRYLYNDSVSFDAAARGMATMGADMRSAGMVDTAPSSDLELLIK